MLEQVLQGVVGNIAVVVSPVASSGVSTTCTKSIKVLRNFMPSRVLSMLHVQYNMVQVSEDGESCCVKAALFSTWHADSC